MKAMTKQQLAASAGVNIKTFRSWCKPYRKQLEDMGLRPNRKVLPPNVVAFLAEKLCIDVPDG